MACGLSRAEALSLTPGEAQVYLAERELLEKRSDLRAAQMMALIANIHRGKNKRPFKVRDFMPEERKASGRKMSADEMIAVARQICAVNGGKRNG